MASSATGVYARRFAFGLLLALLVMTVASPAQQARATKDEANCPPRSWFKPTYGWLTLANTASGSTHPHKVDSFLSWDTTKSLQCVNYNTYSYPRSYEHELRFNPVYGSEERARDWCEGQHFELYTNLPDWYRDYLSIETGEFSFGFPMWRAATKYLYEIKFKCDPQEQYAAPAPPEPVTKEYNLTGQIGHCHGACTDFNVASDETVRLIPRRIGNAPEEAQEFTGSFSFDTTQGAHSFESYVTPWEAPWGNAQRSCADNYHQSCLVLLKPASASNRARLRYVDYPTPQILATGSVFHEVHAKCPTDLNAGSCVVEMRVEARRSDGSVTGASETSYLVPRDASWYNLSLKTGSFPSDATHWAFLITGDYGDTLKLDYAAQGYQDIR